MFPTPAIGGPRFETCFSGKPMLGTCSRWIRTSSLRRARWRGSWSFSRSSRIRTIFGRGRSWRATSSGSRLTSARFGRMGCTANGRPMNAPRMQNAAPFEMGMQGLGVFACRKAAWPGFNPRFSGFGGEEGYIHEKIRRKKRPGPRACPSSAGPTASTARWAHPTGRRGGSVSAIICLATPNSRSIRSL